MVMMRLFGIIFLIYSCQPKFEKDIRRVFFNGQCRCQWYDLNKVEPISKLQRCEDFFSPIREEYSEKCKSGKYAEKYPDRCFELANQDYCNLLLGFSDYSWAENVTPKGREIMRWGQDNCNAKNKENNIPLHRFR